MRRFLFTTSSLFLITVTSWASDSSSTLIVLVQNTRLRMLVGQYCETKKRWIKPDVPFHAPVYQSTFTLFSAEGYLQTVQIDEIPKPWDPIPWDWSSTITSWHDHGNDYALGLSGIWEKQRFVVDPSSVTVPENQLTFLQEYLQKKHLYDPTTITQTLTVDVDHDGILDHLLAVNGETVSLILMNNQVLVDHSAPRPKDRDLDEQHRLYGEPGFSQVLAIVDIDHDGIAEIVTLTVFPSTGPKITIFSVVNGTIVKKLSTALLYF